MTAVLGAVRDMTQWLLVAALAVLVARFDWVVIEPLLQEAPVEPAPTPAEPPKMLAPRPLPKAAPKCEGDCKPVDETLSLLLMARHKREHSAVFVNNELLGHTTFMRNFSCRRGETLALKIVPAKGPAIEKRVRCEGETISISD